MLNHNKAMPPGLLAVPLLMSLLLVACGGGSSGKSNHFSSSSSVPSSSSVASSSVSSASSSVPAEPSLVLAINVGAFASATYKQVEYQADRFYVGGSLSSTYDAIAGTDGEDALFQTERYGSFSYEVPVTDASYDITLHFVEMYQQGSGLRAFNLVVEGQSTDLTSFDIFSEVGHDVAYSYTLENVQVSDGYLTIEIESLIDNGTLSGFAIYSVDGEFVEPPPPPPPPPPVPEEASPENTGADCELESLPGAAQNTFLPDPFKQYDGTRIATQAEWRCRRQEILRQAEAAVYGTKPPKPTSVTGSVTNELITVNVEHDGKSTSFTASVSLPEGPGPFPALIAVSPWPFGLPTAITESEGVATIVFNPYAVGSEQSQRNNKTGAFYDIYGNDSSTGLLVAWAWGVSRILDVLEQAETPIIKPESIGVFGCSRFGKGTFTIGAFDQRIALTVPFESGSGGVPIWRGIAGEGAQSPGSAYGETYWLGDAFAPYTSNVNGLPIDTHQVVAMIAPRGLFIMDNPHIANLGPRSAHVAALAGAEVYKALGAEDNIAYHSNVVDGSHCMLRPEHEEPLRQHLRKFLKGEEATTGGINPHPNTTGNLGEWIDWSTPVLTAE